MENQRSIREGFSSFKLISHSFFDAFSLSVPEFLDELSLEDLTAFLPPPMIGSTSFLCNKKRDISLQISLLNDVDSNLDIKSLLKRMGAQIGHITPGFQMFGSGTKSINGVTVACMDYKSNSLDGDNYTVMFLFLTKKNCYLGNFTAPLTIQKECTQVFLLMISTLWVKSELRC